jgi:hypothetical protein
VEEGAAKLPHAPGKRRLIVQFEPGSSALPSLKNRILPIDCPACHKAQFDVGDLAFTPVATRCKGCSNKFTAPGRLRKTIANPLPGILARLAEKALRQPQHHDLGLMPETL